MRNKLCGKLWNCDTSFLRVGSIKSKNRTKEGKKKRVNNHQQFALLLPSTTQSKIEYIRLFNIYKQPPLIEV